MQVGLKSKSAFWPGNLLENCFFYFDGVLFTSRLHGIFAGYAAWLGISVITPNNG